MSAQSPDASLVRCTLQFSPEPTVAIGQTPQLNRRSEIQSASPLNLRGFDRFNASSNSSAWSSGRCLSRHRPVARRYAVRWSPYRRPDQRLPSATQATPDTKTEAHSEEGHRVERQMEHRNQPLELFDCQAARLANAPTGPFHSDQADGISTDLDYARPHGELHQSVKDVPHMRTALRGQFQLSQPQFCFTRLDARDRLLAPVRQNVIVQPRPVNAGRVGTRLHLPPTSYRLATSVTVIALPTAFRLAARKSSASAQAAAFVGHSVIVPMSFERRWLSSHQR